jgi:hypothetical protein
MVAILTALLLALSAAALQQQERVIAGSPTDSIEVRHLILRGTNEEIGRALADIARERYGARADRASDPLRVRAERRYIETAFPILADRMRGVAAAFGHRADDDTWDHSQLTFTDLQAGCSIVHLPRQATADGQSVVSRDYDYSTGNLNFGFLEPGKLHPTARPYLLELHPDRGYASIAMVAYDLLSGALDGMNSEGLTVSIALDDELFTKYKMEPTFAPAVGLGELQTLRLLLDTCANVEDAKEALLRTKQYYQYIPVHYLIADRFGNAFVWEYSEAHNKEYIIENPGHPLVLTNFSLNKHMEGNNPPSADLARATCRRYAYLTSTLAATPAGITEDALRQIHRNVDAQAPAAANQKRPPIRTFWHALYYPEQRRVKISYYLHDDGDRVVRSDYQEFRLDPTNAPAPPSAAVPSPQPPAAAGEKEKEAESPVVAKLRAAGATVQIERGEVVSIGFAKDSDPAPLLPLLRELPALHLLGFAHTKITDDALAQLIVLKRIDFVGLRDTAITDAGLAHLSKLTGITGLNLSGTKVTDAGLAHLKTMSRLTKLNVSRTAVTEQGVAAAKEWLPFWANVQR